MTVVLHLMAADAWRALGTSEAVGNTSLESEGFIHCTDDPFVLLQVANAFYAGLPGDFVALRVDTDLLTSECIWEEPAHPAHAVDAPAPFAPRFPHVYGPIDRAAVVDATGVQRDADGRFTGYIG